MRVQIRPGVFADIPEHKAAEALAALEERLRRNPLAGYFPHPRQLPFHEAIGRRTPIVAFFGGNQSGKTHCSIADDLIQALPSEWVPEHLLPYKRWDPPFKAWICCPKYAKLDESIFPKIRELTPPSQFKGGSFDAAYSKQDKLLRFACGSEFGFKTYDQDVDAYSSATLHRIHWDEEPSGEHGHQIRKEARARLLKFGGDEILSMTPLLGLSWVYDRVYEPWERGDKRIFVVRADMDDNPFLNEEFKEQYLADLTDEERQARKEGKFVHFRGLVYNEFGEAHILPEKPSKQHVRGLDVVVGIDPGIRTTAVSFNGFDGDNAQLVFDELYLHDEDTTPERAAVHIRGKLAEWGVDPTYFVIDPSSRSRERITGERLDQAYLRAGIPTVEGVNDVETGIFEVKRRLQHRPALFYISPTCTKAIWEFRRYRMDDRADGKFAVVKEDDHLMDTIRYVAMSRPLGPAGGAAESRQERYEPDWAPGADWFDSAPDLSSHPLGDMF